MHENGRSPAPEMVRDPPVFDREVRSAGDRLLIGAHAAARTGLVWATSGNISVRIDTNRFLISGSGRPLAELTHNDLALCSLENDEWQGVLPSIETGLHRAVYHELPKARAVLHAQPAYATVIACTDLTPSIATIPESLAYLPHISRVAYHHPGSAALAKAVAAALHHPEPPVALLLANHGTLAWGRDAAEAVVRTETLEFLCRLAIIAKSARVELNTLDIETVVSFQDHLARLKKI